MALITDKKIRLFKKVFKFALFSFIYVVLPIGILFFAVDEAIRSEDEFSKRQERKKLRAELELLITQSVPLYYSLDIATSINDIMIQKGYSEETFKSIEPDHGFNVEIYVFNSEGSLVYFSNPENFEVAKMLWNFHHRQFDGLYLEFLENIEKFVPFVGMNFPIELFARRKGSSFIIEHTGQTVYLHRLFDQHCQKSGILLFCSNITPLKNNFQKVSKANKRIGNLFAARSSEGFWNSDADKISDESVELIINNMSIKRMDYKYVNSWLFVKTELDNQIFLAGKKIDNRTTFRGHQYVFAIMLVVFFHQMFRWIVMDISFYFSIKYKIPLLFLYLVAIPLMCLLFLSVQLYRVQKFENLSRVNNQALEKTYEIDRAFELYVRNYLDKYRKIVTDKRVKNVQIQELDLWMSELRTRQVLDTLNVFDLDGNVIYPEEVTFKGFRGFKGIEQILHETAVNNHIPHRLAGNKKRETPASLMRQEVISDFAPLFSNTDIDRINRISVNPYSILLYQNVYPSRELRPARAIIYLRKNIAIEKYLNDVIASFEDAQTTEIITGYDVVRDVFWSDISKFKVAVKDIARISSILGQPVHKSISIDRQDYLVTALNCSNLDDIVLVSIVPLKGITETLVKLKNRITASVIFAAIITLVLAKQLSANFLKPINEMSRGISLFKSGENHNPVHTERADELGELMLAFNNAVEELKELELAAIVQKNLFPSSFPDAKGYEFDFFNLPASKLGGDYCDVLLSDDNKKMILLMADAAGHGVPAALMVAIAKAAVFNAAEKEFSINSIIVETNRAIKELVKTRAMMTFFAVEIDFEINSLHYTNAGHPFPIILRSQGKMTELNSTRLPLGSRSKKGFFRQEINLSKDDSLIVFTDGVFEPCNFLKEPFDYTGIKKSLSESIRKPAKEIREKIMADLHCHVGTEAFKDDISIAILKRTD